MLVTTALKAHAVHSLQDYMQIKGMYMKYRLDPTLPETTPGYYEIIVSYLEKHTDIAQCRFWNELDYEQKTRFARFLFYSDDVPNQFNIRSDDKQAQVCVVLNGNADVITRTTILGVDGAPNQLIESKSQYQQGLCFGSFDMFDETYDMLVQQEIESLNSPGKNYRLKEKEKLRKAEELAANGGKLVEEIPTVMTVLMQQGTWLHIGIRDYKDYVLQIAPEPAELEEETDEQISGIPAEKMTEKDKGMVAVKRAAKRKLAESMFTFMSKQELIPHNAGVMSSEFVQHGTAGHSVTLNKDTVYVLIDGRVCMQIYLNRAPMGGAGPSVEGSSGSGSGSSSGSGSGSTRGHITVGTERGPEKGDPFWAYKAAQTVTVARRDMPIILLEAGTIVNLVQEHFEIGQTAVAGDAQGRARGAADREDHSAAAAGDGDGGGGGGGGSGGGGGGSFLPAINPRKGAGAGAGVGAGTDANGYRIRFMNETAVTYLAIPRKTFNAAMRDLSVDHSAEIFKQLESAAELCSNRLRPLTAWVKGAINVIQQNPSNPHNKRKPKLTPAEEAKAKKEKLVGASSSRGILSGNKKRTIPHPRDIQTVNVLELNSNANPTEYTVREQCEGSFLTTDGLKELVQGREMEIERTKKENARKGAQRAKTASPSSSRPSSPGGMQVG